MLRKNSFRDNEKNVLKEFKLSNIFICTCIHVLEFRTSVLFFSIGNVAKIIVKKPPGNVIACEGYRYHLDSYKYQKFTWQPSRVCSFTVSDFSSDYFGRWIIETHYELERNAPRLEPQVEVFYLMDATKVITYINIINNNNYHLV